MSHRNNRAFPFVLALPAIAVSMTVGAADTDTTRLADVVVTASRIPQPEREVIGDVTIITREQLDRHPGKSLADVLASAPGIQISSNGGPGKPSTLLIRGSNRNIMLLNGSRCGSATLGSPAIQNMPVDQIDHIEILRGPAASLYGSDATGGVVQVFTRKGSKDLSAMVQAGIGNLGARELQASLAGSHDNTQYSLGLAYNTIKGVSAIANRDNYSYNPDKDSFSNTSVQASVTHTLNSTTSVGTDLLYASTRNQYDGFIAPYDHRNKGLTGSTSAWIKHAMTDNWTTRLQLASSVDSIDSFKPVSPTDLRDSKSNITTRQNQASWQNDIAIKDGTVTVAVESLEEKVTATQRYTVNKRTTNSAQIGYLQGFGDLRIEASARHDRNSQFGSYNTGHAGASYQLTEQWKIGTATGNSFRVPTFNDLYYPNLGDPNLPPEKGFSKEVFLAFQGSSLQSRLTVYNNAVRNLVNWRSVGGQYKPVNIENANYRGVTLTADWQLNAYQLGGQIDWLHARDTSGGVNDNNYLPRTAEKTAMLYAGYKADRWQARAEWKAVGRRYEEVENLQAMGGYALANLSASWKLNRDVTLLARVDNLFNRKYETAKDYGELGTNGMLSVRWALK